MMIIPLNLKNNYFSNYDSAFNGPENYLYFICKRMTDFIFISSKIHV